MAAINPSTSKLWLRLVTRCSILFRKKKKIKMVFLSFLSILPFFFSFYFFYSSRDSSMRDVWNVDFNNSFVKDSEKKRKKAWRLRVLIENRLVNCWLFESKVWLRRILIFNKRGFRNRIDARSNRLQGPILSGRKIFYQTIKLISIIYNIVKFV